MDRTSSVGARSAGCAQGGKGMTSALQEWRRAGDPKSHLNPAQPLTSEGPLSLLKSELPRSHDQGPTPTSIRRFCFWAICFPGGVVVKNLPANAGDTGDMGSMPGSGRCPGGGTAIHSGILAWRILWTEEPDGLQSMGSQESDTTEHTRTHEQGCTWTEL